MIAIVQYLSLFPRASHMALESRELWLPCSAGHAAAVVKSNERSQIWDSRAI